MILSRLFAALLFTGAPSASTVPPVAPHPVTSAAAPTQRATIPVVVNNEHEAQWHRNRKASRRTRISVYAAHRLHTRPPRHRWRPPLVMSSPYRAGEAARLVSRSRFLTAVALCEGEKVIARAAGDTVGWSLAETAEGAGPTVKPIILIRPSEAGLHTNFVITTDQRTYLISARSAGGEDYTQYLSWSFADHGCAKTGAPAPTAAPAAAPGVDIFPVRAINQSYHIHLDARSGVPPWIPKKVFDDGARTYIEFGSGFEQDVAPPMFSLNSNEKLELVNYRVWKNFYIVDRVIHRAKIVYGEAPQQSITIEKAGGR